MAAAIAAFVNLSDAELVSKLADTKQELFNLRFQRAQGQLENSARMGILRKDVARINMLLRAREIAAAESLHTGTPRGPRSLESTSLAGKK